MIAINGIEFCRKKSTFIQYSNNSDKSETIHGIDFLPGTHIVKIEKDDDDGWMRYQKAFSYIGYKMIAWRRGQLQENPFPNLGSCFWGLKNQDINCAS